MFAEAWIVPNQPRAQRKGVPHHHGVNSGCQAAGQAPAKTCEGDTTIAEAGHLGRAYRGTPMSSTPNARGDWLVDTAVRGNGTFRASYY